MTNLVLHPSGLYRQNALMVVAQNALAKGEFRQAWLAYRQILRDTPHNAEVWIKLGGFFANGVILTLRVFAYIGVWLNLEDGQAWAKLADFHRLKGELGKAQIAIEKAQALSVTDPIITYYAGLIFREMGRIKAARDAFHAAQRLGYDDKDLLWDFAVCDFLEGDFPSGFARLHGQDMQYPDAHNQMALPTDQQKADRNLAIEGIAF